MRWCWYMTNHTVGIIGATSLVGTRLIPMLINRGVPVCAYSRHSIESVRDGVTWRNLSRSGCSNIIDQVDYWICVAPIWVLPEHFPLLEASGVRRVVVLSSTSRFTKDDSTDPEEHATSLRLAESESLLQTWAENRRIEWIILRPTLIYGLGLDKNITEIARFIQRFHFFPLFGKANGLRQPIHANDVASACITTLLSSNTVNCTYNISGGESLSYRSMVVRVFTTLGRRPRLINVPLWVFRLAVALLRHLPRYRHWSAAMAERMNRNLIFSHDIAAHDFDFKPRGFTLSTEDLPQ